MKAKIHTSTGLLRRCWARELNILDTKGIKSLGNGDLGLGIEKGVGELFTLYQ